MKNTKKRHYFVPLVRDSVIWRLLRLIRLFILYKKKETFGKPAQAVEIKGVENEKS